MQASSKHKTPAATEANWLIKSGDRILGPFTLDQVTSQLRSKEIAIIDEALVPFGRWRVIRDDPKFAAVVEEVRGGHLSAREDTEVQGHATHTQTQTDHGLQPVPVVSDDDFASRTRDRIPIDSGGVIDAEFTEDKPMEPAWRRSEETSRSSTVRQYGVGSATAYERNATRTKKRVWVVAIVVIVGAIYLMNRTPGPADDVSGKSRNSDYSQDLADAKKAWNSGEFSIALNLLRQADHKRPNQAEVVSRLAPLMIRLEGETVNAKRALNAALAALPANADAKTKAELEAGLGLAALASDDIAEAEARFLAAKKAGLDDFAIRFDYAIAAFAKRDFSEAVKRFTDAGAEPAALLMRARSLQQGDGATGRLRESQDAIMKVASRQQDFSQEAYVMSSALELDAGNKKAALERVNAALSLDPDLTADHWHDPFLYLEPLSWHELATDCRKIGDGLKDASAQALAGLCLFKAGEREDGNRLIANALGRSPEEPILESVSAFVLVSTGRLSDARAALKLAGAKGGEMPCLASLVNARVCAESGETACAEQNWTRLAAEPAPMLAALVGLAEIRKSQGDRRQVLRLIEKAKSLSPRYMPAMKFKADSK